MDENKNEAEQWRKNSKHDCDNLEFKTQKVVFFPEDVEKMKNMDIDEELEYMTMLKREGRYTVE